MIRVRILGGISMLGRMGRLSEDVTVDQGSETKRVGRFVYSL